MEMLSDTTTIGDMFLSMTVLILVLMEMLSDR